MPPEQIQDVHLQPLEADFAGDPRSDIFSLAVILYELLTGKLPFGDPPACVTPRQAAEALLAAQQQAPRPVRNLNPAVSTDLAQLLHKCLAIEPSQRPESATSLVSELKKYFSPRRRARRWASRHRGLVTTLLLLFILTLSSSIWHLSTRPSYPIRQYYDAVHDIERERYREAIEHLDRAIERQSDCEAFRIARGIAYQLLGEHQMADSDFSQVVKGLKNPLVLECCAYSKLHMPTKDAKFQARRMYERLSVARPTSPELEARPMSPELKLNWAYSYLEGDAVPILAISRVGAAIDAKPEWQRAYHLRAIANYRWVNPDFKCQKPGDPARIIDDSIQDFEHALSLEPMSQRLYSDAAKAYALHDRDAPSERLKELLGETVNLGISKGALGSIGGRYSWKDAPWYLKLMQRCDPTAEALPSEKGYFLTPPDYEAVRQYLRETQPMLPESAPSERSENAI